MSRLPYPAPGELPTELQDFLAQLPQDAVLRQLSHSPSTVRLHVLLGQSLFTSLELPARLRELAVLTVAAAADCDYVFSQHEPISDTVGVSAAERTAIRSGAEPTESWSPVEAATIRFAREVVRSPRMDDPTFEAARRWLTDRELVELLQVCTYYLSFSRVCTVLDLPVSVHGAGVLDDILRMRDS